MIQVVSGPMVPLTQFLTMVTIEASFADQKAPKAGRRMKTPRDTFETFARKQLQGMIKRPVQNVCG